MHANGESANTIANSPRREPGDGVPRLGRADC
jgi:hypothetical protein